MWRTLIVAEVAWVTLSEIPRYIPYGLFKPVQRHLDVVTT